MLVVWGTSVMLLPLAFVSVGMLLSRQPDSPAEVSLAVIAGILAVGALAPIVGARRGLVRPQSPPPDVTEKDVLTIAYRGARRVVVLIVGSAVTLAGLVMLFAPGPAFLVIPLGLLILASEFHWARRLLHGFRDRFRHAIARHRSG